MRRFVQVQDIVINPRYVATVSWQEDGNGGFLLEIDLASGQSHELTMPTKNRIDKMVEFLTGDRFEIQ